MAYQTVFQRYELKYLLTRAQMNKVLAAMKPYMESDKYGRTTIRNLYFDTDNYRLIRHSIEKPVYKEKLRIRSYQKASPDRVPRLFPGQKLPGIQPQAQPFHADGGCDV